MILDFPDTSTKALERTMLELREAGGAVSLSRVLTLVISAEDSDVEAAIESANAASREHPCRVIAVGHGNPTGPSSLNAQLRVGGDAGASEVLVMYASGELGQHPDALATPFLLPDAPVVTWWPHHVPDNPAGHRLGHLATRRITNMAADLDFAPHLQQLAMNYQPGDTDLAWSRITLWRRLLAAALDQGPEQADSIDVVAGSDSPSGQLLAAWLEDRLGTPATLTLAEPGCGILAVELGYDGKVLSIAREATSDIAVVQRTDGPARELTLPHRTEAVCVAEELRRLEPDPIYHAALALAARRLAS